MPVATPTGSEARMRAFKNKGKDTISGGRKEIGREGGKKSENE